MWPDTCAVISPELLTAVTTKVNSPKRSRPLSGVVECDWVRDVSATLRAVTVCVLQQQRRNVGPGCSGGLSFCRRRPATAASRRPHQPVQSLRVPEYQHARCAAEWHEPQLDLQRAHSGHLQVRVRLLVCVETELGSAQGRDTGRQTVLNLCVSVALISTLQTELYCPVYKYLQCNPMLIWTVSLGYEQRTQPL
jgi:hypothetical protein